MIIVRGLGKDSSSQTPDQRTVSLADQVKLACWGHTINDVGAVALGLLMNVIVQKTTNKEEALEFADLTMKEMHKIIERDYQEMLDTMHNVTEQ